MYSVTDQQRVTLQIVLLNGPPGLGKTTLAHIIAKHCGYNVVEMNARYSYYIIMHMKDFKNLELIKYFINNTCIHTFSGTFFNFLFLYQWWPKCWCVQNQTRGRNSDEVSVRIGPPTQLSGDWWNWWVTSGEINLSCEHLPLSIKKNTDNVLHS